MVRLAGPLIKKRPGEYPRGLKSMNGQAVFAGRMVGNCHERTSAARVRFSVVSAITHARAPVEYR